MSRTPPYSEDAEQSVLGSILLDAERVLDLAVGTGIRPESFHVPQLRCVYEAMLEMWRAGRPIDILTVAEKLKMRGDFDKSGDGFDVDQLVDAVPTAAHAA